MGSLFDTFLRGTVGETPKHAHFLQTPNPLESKKKVEILVKKNATKGYLDIPPLDIKIGGPDWGSGGGGRGVLLRAPCSVGHPSGVCGGLIWGSILGGIKKVSFSRATDWLVVFCTPYNLGVTSLFIGKKGVKTGYHFWGVFFTIWVKNVGVILGGSLGGVGVGDGGVGSPFWLAAIMCGVIFWSLFGDHFDPF